MNSRRDFIEVAFSVPLASAFLDGKEPAKGVSEASTSTVNAISLVNPDDLRLKDQWVEEHLLGTKPTLLFSFVFGTRSFDALLAAWPKETHEKNLDPARTQRTITWLDPKTAMEVRLVAVDYVKYPVIDWTVYFTNHGTNKALSSTTFKRWTPPFHLPTAVFQRSYIPRAA